jgi:hypothetical protein
MAALPLFGITFSFPRVEFNPECLSPFARSPATKLQVKRLFNSCGISRAGKIICSLFPELATLGGAPSLQKELVLARVTCRPERGPAAGTDDGSDRLEVTAIR